jgi:hypothetical protein
VRWKPFKCNGCVTAFIRCTFHCQNMWNAQGQSVLEWNFTIFHNLHNLSMLKCFATSLDIMFKLSFKKFFFFFFFFAVLGLEFWSYILSHSTSPFLWRVFVRQGLKELLAGWLRTTILLIYACWGARTTGMSHRCPASWLLWMVPRKL